MTRWINKQIPFSLPVVQCRLSVAYTLNQDWQPSSGSTKANWKTALAEPTIDMNNKVNAFYVRCIKEYSCCSFIQEGTDIASIAFCTSNGAHTVETQRRYRNR